MYLIHIEIFLFFYKMLKFGPLENFSKRRIRARSAIMHVSRTCGKSADNLSCISGGPVLIAPLGQSFEYVWLIDNWNDQTIDPVSPDFVIHDLSFHMQACRPKAPSQFLSIKTILVEQPQAPKTFTFFIELLNTNPSKNISKRATKAYSRINSYESVNLTQGRKITEEEGFLKEGALTIRFKYTPTPVRHHSPRTIDQIPTSANSTTEALNLSNSGERSATKSNSLSYSSFHSIVSKVNPYSGLYNQGATCYMNSILQVLFHIPSFRRIVFSMPTTGTEDYLTSIPLNLQSLFCNMQFNKTACSTSDLTHSFGWKASDTSKQQDVLEFERILIQNLESKLKNTQWAGHLTSLFTGKQRTFIRCRNVSFSHLVDEEFDNLPLIVRGVKNLEESFRKELETQELTGDEQYNSGEFGMQDAVMGTEFLSFPPVLMIQLRRFEHDWEKNRNIKINDYFEYPKEIDLTPYLSPHSEQLKRNNKYILFSVIVHSGSIASGHYYAYIRPSFPGGQWYKFDDSNVTEATESDVFERNFGGPLSSTNSTVDKSFSAYSLMYVSQEDVASIYEPVPDDFVPIHIRESVKAHEEAKRTELPLDYIDIRLNGENSIRINAMKWTTGFNNRTAATIIRLNSSETLKALYEKAASFTDTHVNNIRLWKCGSYMIPEEPLIIDEQKPKLSDYLLKSSAIFVQRIFPEKGEIAAIKDDEKVLFMKFFFFPNSEQNYPATIQYIGAKTTKSETIISDFFSVVNTIVGLPESTPLIVFQETIQHTAQLISDPQNTKFSEVGPLLIFQISPGVDVAAPNPEIVSNLTETNTVLGNCSSSDYFNPLFSSLPIISYYKINPELAPTTVDQYMDHKLRTMEAVMFHYEDTTKTGKAIIRFPSNLSWPALKRLIAIAVKVDYEPENDSMRIYKRSVSGGPSKYPISMKFASSMQAALADSAPIKGERSHLFYSVLHGIPESMLSSMANYNLQYSENALKVSCTTQLLISKGSTLQKIAFEMQNRGILPQSDSLRVLQILSNRIVKATDMYEDEVVTNYAVTWRFEIIPIEQRNFDEKNQLLIAVSKGYIDSFDVARFVADPFIFLCNNTDTIGSIRNQLLTAANVPNEELDSTVILKLDNKNGNNVPFMESNQENQTNIFLNSFIGLTETDMKASPVDNNAMVAKIVSNGAQIFIWQPNLQNIKNGKNKVTFIDHAPPKLPTNEQPRIIEQPLKIYN